jgi:hypothetical protein
MTGCALHRGPAGRGRHSHRNKHRASLTFPRNSSTARSHEYLQTVGFKLMLKQKMRRPEISAEIDRRNQAKERERENCNCALYRTLGRALGRHVDIASLGRGEEGGHFELHRTGSKTISASKPSWQLG